MQIRLKVEILPASVGVQPNRMDDGKYFDICRRPFVVVVVVVTATVCNNCWPKLNNCYFATEAAKEERGKLRLLFAFKGKKLPQFQEREIHEMLLLLLLLSKHSKLGEQASQQDAIGSHKLRRLPNGYQMASCGVNF